MYPGLSLRSLTALAALTLISTAQSHAIGIKSGNQDAAATARGGTWLSAGYWHAQQTVPDKTFSPRVPDAPLNVFSVGAGFENERWRVGLTYQHGIAEERTVSGSPVNALGGSADGTYSNITTAVAVTVGVKF